ncbi:type IV secretory system conjugative DNA transfer family protein, partial [Saccharococcus caldoxylosilyticus]
DNRNVLVIGSSGSGKGQSFVFPNMINHTEETIIVTDPKGEIYEATHQIKRDQGYKVYQVDFINFVNCDRYNPLDYVEDDEDARAIANTIASNSVDEGKRDFWSESAVAFLSAFILYVKEKYKDKANMRHVVEMVARAGKDEEYLDEIIKNMSPDHPAYHMFTLANMSSGNTRA